MMKKNTEYGGMACCEGDTGQAYLYTELYKTKKR